jgi:hypothetical protein
MVPAIGTSCLGQGALFAPILRALPQWLGIDAVIAQWVSIRASLGVFRKGARRPSSCLALCSLVSLLVLGAACTGAGEPGQRVASATPYPTLQATRTASPAVTPTAIVIGQFATYNTLQVALDQSEFSQAYITEFNSSRLPPAGNQFLWVRVTLENTGDHAYAVPALEHFSVLYYRAEYKATYGHRKDFVDYTALPPQISPGQKLPAWLRFDLPQAAKLPELLFAFLPESSHVDFSISSEGYAWAVHPVYLWRLGP